MMMIIIINKSINVTLLYFITLRKKHDLRKVKKRQFLRMFNAISALNI